MYYMPTMPVLSQPNSYAPEQDAFGRLQVTLAINYWGAFYLTHLLLSRINQQAFSRCTMAVVAAFCNPPPMPSLLHLFSLWSAEGNSSAHTWGISHRTKNLCSGCRIVFVNSISECHGKVDWEDLQGFKPQHSDYSNYARSECRQGHHQLQIGPLDHCSEARWG